MFLMISVNPSTWTSLPLPPADPMRIFVQWRKQAGQKSANSDWALVSLLSSICPISRSYDSFEQVIFPRPSLYGPPSVEPESTMIAWGEYVFMPYQKWSAM